MESDVLRFVLLGLGVLLVVGIYAWDRYSKVQKHIERIEPTTDQHADPDVELGLEPFELDPEPGKSDTQKQTTETQGRLDLDDEDFLPAGESVGEPKVVRRWTEEPAAQLRVDADSELEFSAHEDSSYLDLDPALMDEVPRKIIQIQVISRGLPFDMHDIKRVTAEVDMQYGDMQIYHRENERGQVLFSMATLVEPGTFPTDEDAEFKTPGVLLFTQLPGVQDGLSIYSDMLFTAERLAAVLKADLKDETHSVLTRQTIEHTRDSILEHRRQIQLIRSRR